MQDQSSTDVSLPKCRICGVLLVYSGAEKNCKQKGRKTCIACREKDKTERDPEKNKDKTKCKKCHKYRPAEEYIHTFIQCQECRSKRVEKATSDPDTDGQSSDAVGQGETVRIAKKKDEAQKWRQTILSILAKLKEEVSGEDNKAVVDKHILHWDVLRQDGH